MAHSRERPMCRSGASSAGWPLKIGWYSAARIASSVDASTASGGRSSRTQPCACSSSAAVVAPAGGSRGRKRCSPEKRCARGRGGADARRHVGGGVANLDGLHAFDVALERKLDRLPQLWRPAVRQPHDAQRRHDRLDDERAAELVDGGEQRRERLDGGRREAAGRGDGRRRRRGGGGRGDVGAELKEAQRQHRVLAEGAVRLRVEVDAAEVAAVPERIAVPGGSPG